MNADVFAEYLLKFSTLVSVIFSGWAAIAASSAARAAIKQASIAHKAMVGDQRAWLNVRLVPESDFEVYPAGVQINIGVVIKNIGRTPALKAHTNIETVSKMGDIVEKLKNMALDNEADFGLACRVVLPGEEYVRPWGVTFDEDPAISGESEYIKSYILGVTTYNIMDDAAYHHTAFAYYCERITDNPMIWVPLRVDRGGIPKEEIKFSVIGGGFAS